ncbi:Phosphate uptake regulator [Alteracholeplasma palmae J233]|uniref:Phosphate-specific transport system accessory protein PhoU n=1 Tax=Alteracholeplasma palmae (strain ATCC 49389 / J233) TaxID=1318466 RepID=U4KJW3_ALTPJ|nr:phosphate signaling complex protein PhoU [Alteracholeplasma palmae]CCV63748.1 Phosphate uptake regulator [Alteracholeplasma palmae J233]
MPALRTGLLVAVEEIKTDVVTMADLVLKQIKDSLVAFKENDVNKAQVIIGQDDAVDKMEEDIAKKALRIIWKEQPLAQDLRLVTGILKLITDIERIGDHACDIAEITLHLSNIPNKRVIPVITEMSLKSEEMVLLAIEALVTQDKEKANTVIALDDKVDELFSNIMKKIAQALKDDGIDQEYALSLLMIAKYIERISDHAVNIAEWIIFIVTGNHKTTALF